MTEEQHAIARLKHGDLTGLDIKVPSQMPADVHFAYAAYHDPQDPEKGLYGSLSSPEIVLVYFASTYDSHGGYYGYVFSQTQVPATELASAEMQLKEEATWNGAEWVTVHGQPAIYSMGCSDNAASGGETTCVPQLSWLDESGIRHNVSAYLPGALDKDVFLAIAESIQ